MVVLFNLVYVFNCVSFWFCNLNRQHVHWVMLRNTFVYNFLHWSETCLKWKKICPLGLQYKQAFLYLKLHSPRECFIKWLRMKNLLDLDSNIHLLRNRSHSTDRPYTIVTIRLSFLIPTVLIPYRGLVTFIEVFWRPPPPLIALQPSLGPGPFF